MREIKRSVYFRTGKTWNQNPAFVETDEAEVYKRLAKDLIAKKINHAPIIRTIKRYSNYDGTQTIEVVQDNGVKIVYVVEN
jgi:hypothetical protein